MYGYVKRLMLLLLLCALLSGCKQAPPPVLTPSMQQSMEAPPAVTPTPEPLPTPKTAQRIDVPLTYLETVGGARLYRMGDTPYITLEPAIEYDVYKDAILLRAKALRALAAAHPDVDFFAYFIKRAGNCDWYRSAGFDVYDYASLAQRALTEDGTIEFGMYEPADFQQYMEESYRLDFHQNHIGTYRSYTEAYALMCKRLPLSPMLKPVGEMDYDALRISYYKLTENPAPSEDMDVFKTYRYDLGEYQEFVNGRERTLGMEEEYARGEFDRDPYALHQLSFFGVAGGAVRTEFHHPDAPDLLLLGDSQCRPFRKLLAYHFNTTYYMDLDTTNQTDLDAFIRENGIDAVALIGQMSMFESYDAA
ncbi:MAG: hypothetical protein PHC80_00120 [Eubacteriales bacterium]|nr:hypothetical protein [Eubacteriales bacterium]